LLAADALRFTAIEPPFKDNSGE
jgi:DNA-binding MarR family transcriptional regulator